jgi:hypothetical protein
MKAGVLKIRAGDERLRLGGKRFLQGRKIAKLTIGGILELCRSLNMFILSSLT